MNRTGFAGGRLVLYQRPFVVTRVGFTSGRNSDSLPLMAGRLGWPLRSHGRT
jgi:hypothetical protein